MPRYNRTKTQLLARIRELEDGWVVKDNARVNAENLLQSDRAEFAKQRDSLFAENAKAISDIAALKVELESRSLSFVKLQAEVNERFGERVARLDSDLKFVIRERDEARAELQLAVTDKATLLGENESLLARDAALVDDNNALLAANTRLLADLVCEQDSVLKLKEKNDELNQKYSELVVKIFEMVQTINRSILNASRTVSSAELNELNNLRGFFNGLLL